MRRSALIAFALLSTAALAVASGSDERSAGEFDLDKQVVDCQMRGGPGETVTDCLAGVIASGRQVLTFYVEALKRKYLSEQERGSPRQIALSKKMHGQISVVGRTYQVAITNLCDMTQHKSPAPARNLFVAQQCELLLLGAAISRMREMRARIN